MDTGKPGLDVWRERARALETAVNSVVIAQQRAVRLLTISVFARGHVLLEGEVGVGKTTLLRALTRALGGAFERIEATIDLMPGDLVYHAFISEEGQPRVDPGPLVRHGEALSVFFFNEINRARPQVHSLMLRAMAERSVSAFNREHFFPHLQVFADRNRVEKEETFELPAAVRDRFLMEIGIEPPADVESLLSLMSDPRFHDTDRLIEGVPDGMVEFDLLNEIAASIQREIATTETLERYALDLCLATRDPQGYGLRVGDLDTADLVLAGVSPRGMSALLRAARVLAWLEGRSAVMPEDVRDVFPSTVGHRVFYTPVYEMRRAEVSPLLIGAVLDQVAAP